MINHLDMRADNYCTIKEYTSDIQKQLINCTLIWLDNNNLIEEKEQMILYFKNKNILFDKIFKNQPEFKKYFNFYVADMNQLIDFCKEHISYNDHYEFIKIKSVSKNFYIGAIINDETFILKKTYDEYK
jgi:hypothetical protein